MAGKRSGTTVATVFDNGRRFFMEKNIEIEYQEKEIKKLRDEVERLKEAEGALKFLLRKCNNYVSNNCIYCNRSFCSLDCNSSLSLESQVIDYLEKRRAGRKKWMREEHKWRG